MCEKTITKLYSIYSCFVGDAILAQFLRSLSVQARGCVREKTKTQLYLML